MIVYLSQVKAKTGLVFITGPNTDHQSSSVTSWHCIEEVLQENVVLFSGFIDEYFTFMLTTARLHTAAVVRQCLVEVYAPVIAWHVWSADLNLIEHRWDELQKWIRTRNTAPTSLGELRTAIKEELDRIPHDFPKKVFYSMKNWMEDYFTILLSFYACSKSRTQLPKRPILDIPIVYVMMPVMILKIKSRYCELFKSKQCMLLLN